jgi:uncharacterized protein YggL (DUF469 family)
MRAKLFKILEQKADCVLLKKDLPLSEVHRVKYFVRDTENDIIYSGYDYNQAEKVFNDYDINKVRAERKKIFEDWLAEFAEPKSEE